MNIQPDQLKDTFVLVKSQPLEHWYDKFRDTYELFEVRVTKYEDVTFNTPIDEQSYIYMRNKGDQGIDIHVALYTLEGELVNETTWAPDCDILWAHTDDQVIELLKEYLYLKLWV